MMIRNSLFLSLILAATMTLSSVQAMASTEAKIAVVDIEKVVKSSTAAQDIHNQIAKKNSAYNAEFKKKEAAFKKESEDIAKQQAILSHDAYNQKVNDFKSRVAETQKNVQATLEKLGKADEQATRQLQKAVLDIVSELAKEKGFTIAIPTSQILYASPDMDITSDVLAKLNARLTKIPVKIDSSESDGADSSSN